MNRNRILAMIHVAFKHLGWDDATRRAWLEKQTGKTSCKDCSESQLSLVADLLRDMGALDQPAAVKGTGGTGPDRPTQAQWRYVVALSKECGLSGAIEDPGLITHCKRVTKADNPRFLDRQGMHALITSLEGWAASKKRRAAPTNEKRA
jgi:phage gp16-like protein